jgi:hypothetical protein
MNIHLGKELENDTFDRVDNYDKFTEKKIILVDRVLLNENNYKTAKIAKVVFPEAFGLTDRYFGGNIFRCAIMKDSPYVILVDKFFNSLGLLLPKENLHLLTVKELVALCERYRIAVTKETKKDELIELLKKH